MSEQPLSSSGLETSNTLLIVVGAHLRAEIADRPLAYALRDHALKWLADHRDQLNINLGITVCCDIWYLNNEKLQHCPTISLGGPGVNALSAYYSQRLKQDTNEEQHVLIQIDPEFTDLSVCIWGSNHDLTVKGMDLFINQYLDGYLRAVVTQVEPHAD